MLEKNIKQITANEPEKEAKNNFSDMLKAKNQNKKKKTIKAPPRTVHQTSSIIFKKQKHTLLIKTLSLSKNPHVSLRFVQ